FLTLLQELWATAAVASGEPHQAAFMADQPLVDVVELLDQCIDAGLIKPQRFDLLDDLFLEFLVLAPVTRSARAGRMQLVMDVLLLQAAQPLELVGDSVN